MTQRLRPFVTMRKQASTKMLLFFPLTNDAVHFGESDLKHDLHRKKLAFPDT